MSISVHCTAHRHRFSEIMEQQYLGSRRCLCRAILEKPVLVWGSSRPQFILMLLYLPTGPPYMQCYRWLPLRSQSKKDKHWAYWWQALRVQKPNSSYSRATNGFRSWTTLPWSKASQLVRTSLCASHCSGPWETTVHLAVSPCPQGAHLLVRETDKKTNKQIHK